MTTDTKPLPERFDCTNGNTPWCQGCYRMEPGEYGDYVQWEDYERIIDAKDAEIERLRSERDSFQRVGIAAQARTEQLAEALRRQRGWWLASKGEAVSNAPGGLTRIDPGFIALCDAHVQQIDLTLRDHDQEEGK